jgi:hypothetical protein
MKYSKVNTLITVLEEGENLQKVYLEDSVSYRYPAILWKSSMQHGSRQLVLLKTLLAKLGFTEGSGLK